MTSPGFACNLSPLRGMLVPRFRRGTDMDHKQKVDHLLNDLEQRGVRRFTTAPPIHRILWSLGSKTPPPHFASFGSLALIMGLTFGVGLIVLDFMWRDRTDMPLGWSIVGAAIVGVGFGLFMGTYYRKKARGLGLPARWEDYPQTGSGVNPRP